jgi:ribosome biogenesis GTPase
MNKHDNNSLVNGQVVAVYKDRYLVEQGGQKITAEVSGRFKYIHYEKSDFPQIGDYVNYRKADDYLGIIESISERKSVLERSESNNGAITGKQILAVNVDIVFICLSLNEDFNIVKLRNFLSLTYDKNFRTIILLTKKDICEDIQYFIDETKMVTDNEIIAITVFDKSDLKIISDIINNDTAVFIGSSGVGKSTIINKLIEEEHFKTSSIRLSDAQGRHTTVNRELINLKNGGKVIDTPGIRVIYSYFVDETSFTDIMSLSESCKYNDCTHDLEPGCKVKEALETGELDIERWHQYVRVLRENRFLKHRELCKERMLNKRLKKAR